MPLIHRAQYYYAILLKDEKRYNDAYRYITGVLDKDNATPYRKFLVGLRAKVFEKMGRTEEAEKDMLSVQYDLEV